MKKITSGLLLFFFPKINSQKWRIGIRDAVQALMRGILVDCITVAIQSLKAEKMVFDWKAIAIAGLTTALTYITYAWFNGKPKTETLK